MPVNLLRWNSNHHKGKYPQLSDAAVCFLEKLYVNAVEQLKSSDISSELNLVVDDYVGSNLSWKYASDSENSFRRTIALILAVCSSDDSTPWKSFPVFEVSGSQYCL